MAGTALSPVAAAVHAALDVSAVTTLATGGVHRDNAAQGVAFPFISHDVRERDVRGFGTGALPEVDLRVHAYSTAPTFAEAQSIIDAIVGLLRDAVLAVAGFQQCGRVFYDGTEPVSDSLINGVTCRELVAFFRVYVEA
jgi:hypothetical protein